MYSKSAGTQITILGSPSLQPNNLSVSNNLAMVCFVRLSDVFVADPTGNCVKIPVSKTDIYQVSRSLCKSLDIIDLFCRHPLLL